MSNRQLEDKMEEERNKKLAKILGISYDDLSMSDYDIDNEESSDGFIYNLIIRFRNSTPKNILRQIRGIDESGSVYLDPNALD